MMDTQEIAARLKAYLADQFLAGPQAETLTDETDLLMLLDSLQILKLVIALESLFGVKMRDGEIGPETVGTVQKVAAFVAGKSAGCAEAEPEATRRRAGSVSDGSTDPSVAYASGS